MTQVDLFAETSQNLKRIKLGNIRVNLEDHLRVAQAKSLTYLEFLHGLTQEEIHGREQSNYLRRLKAAKFPADKTFDSFDFAFQPTLSKDKVVQLQDCRWVANAENIILAGQAGTGKTHLAIALGHRAIECGYHVYFTSLADLLDQIHAGTITGQIHQLQRKLLKQDVIILDELGYLKVRSEPGNFLFRLVSQAYEKRSLIITTNKDFSGWAEIFEDQVQVAAMLDRLLHHSHIFSLSGDSYRIKHRATETQTETGEK